MSIREVEHETAVDAPADEVYRLLAEVENWPRVFPPTVHVDQVPLGGGEERIHIWATANGEARGWTSRRTLNPVARCITFRQERSSPPVASMEGAWIVEPAASGSRVRLLHTYRAVDDDPAGLEWIDRAVDGNSHTELAALKTNAELALNRSDLTLTFTDTVEIDGSATDVYDFVNEAQHWCDRLPHVADVSLREDTPGLQVLRMDTLTPGGDRHTTESVRLCFPHHRIIYKQTTLPALMSMHTGQWDFVPVDGGATASSQHTVVIDGERIEAVLGEGSTVADARRFLRDALGANSRTTLEHAGAYARARP